MWNESKLHWRQQHTGFSRLFNALITLKQDSIKPASMQSCFELLVYRCSHSSVISVAAGFTGRQRQLGCALVSKSSIFQVPCLCSFILFPPLERQHFRQWRFVTTRVLPLIHNTQHLEQTCPARQDFCQFMKQVKSMVPTDLNHRLLWRFFHWKLLVTDSVLVLQLKKKLLSFSLLCLNVNTFPFFF